MAFFLLFVSNFLFLFINCFYLALDIFSDGTIKLRWSKKFSHHLASVQDGDVNIWDSRHFNQPIYTLTDHQDLATSVDWSPFDQARILSSGYVSLFY